MCHLVRFIAALPHVELCPAVKWPKVKRTHMGPPASPCSGRCLYHHSSREPPSGCDCALMWAAIGSINVPSAVWTTIDLNSVRPGQCLRPFSVLTTIVRAYDYCPCLRLLSVLTTIVRAGCPKADPVRLPSPLVNDGHIRHWKAQDAGRPAGDCLHC